MQYKILELILELLTHEKMIFCAILSCGLYTGYTDFRYGKIANIYTLILIAFGVISQAFFVTAGEMTWVHGCTTLFGGLAISFAMFYTGIWAAGDAKLFWGISLLMPPSVFSHTTETQFYPLILLFNIFLLFFIYITLKSIIKMPLRKQGALISKSFITQLKQFPKRILQALSCVGVGGMAFYIPSQLGVGLDLAIGIILFMTVAFTFDKVVEKYIAGNYKIAVRTCVSILAIFLAIRSLTNLGIFVLFIFFISFFILTFSSYVHSLFTKQTALKNLKPNMIPAERIVRIQAQQGTDKYIKVPASLANPAQDDIIVDVSSEGLTDKQITHLHRLAADGCLQTSESGLLIQEKIPFAFMIVIGALINLLAKGMAYSIIQQVEFSQVIESVRLFFA